MRDGFETDEITPLDPSDDDASPGDGAPADGLKSTLGQTFAGRPLMVYLVLFAGAATLLALLAVVWMSATGGGSDERPICTTITAPEARDAILAGQVSRINILVDREKPLQSLTGVVLDLNDETCRQSPQGADFRDDLYMIIGAIEHYNAFADRKVRIHYQEQQVDPALLSTSTPTAAPTTPPTEGPTITPTLAPTKAPTATLAPPTATPSATVIPTSPSTATGAIAAPTSPPTPPAAPDTTPTV